MMEAKQYRPQRFSRRRLLTGAAFGSAGMALAAIAGCRKPEQPRAAPTARQPKRGGILSRTTAGIGGADWGGLDPHPLQLAWTGLMGLFYQTLIHRNPRTYELEPELAQKWEQPSPTEYIFTLQPGVKFHNKPPATGRALTTDDVVFSLNRVRTNDPRFQNRRLLDPVDKIEAVDRSRVKVTTKQPDVTTLGNLAAFPVKVLAPEVVERFEGRFSTAESAVGTGAFILQAVDDVGGSVIRNPEYWKPGLPYLDGVQMRYIVDDETSWAAFLGGQLDISYVPGTLAKKVFDEQEGKPYAAEWFKDVSYTSAQANVRRKPFDDPRVTRALRLLVDHEEASHRWAVTWFGRGYVCSHFPAALEDWDFTEEEYVSKFLEFKRPKDEAVREALRLLTAAGFSRDNPLRFAEHGQSGTFTQNMVELHQAQVNRMGQGVVQITELKLFTLAQLNNVQAQGDFDYSLSNIVPPQPYDPDSWFTTIYVTNGGRNYGRMSDPKLDAMIEKQRTIFETAQRRAFVKEMLAYMIENAPYTGWSGRYVLNARHQKVQDWAPESRSAVWGYQYEQVWLDT